MPAPAHSCPKCSPENPCYFSEGEIVSLREAFENEAPAPWTGIVLDVERDASGRVYRVLWGPPPANFAASAAITAKYSGQHRRDELIRFLVPLAQSLGEIRVGEGGGREGLAHRFSPPPGL